MAAGLAATTSNSAREAHDRSRTGARLAALESFRFLGEDRLTPAAAAQLGDGVRCTAGHQQQIVGPRAARGQRGSQYAFTERFHRAQWRLRGADR